MTTRKTAILAALLLLLAVAGASAAGKPRRAANGTPGHREVLPLQLEEEIPIPDAPGRLDHFTADVRRHRLIFSALGNNTVEVIDTFAGRRVQTISGLSFPQGVLYVPDFDQLFIANAGNGKVNVYDGATLQLRKSLDIGADPDNLRYDPVSRKVLVGYGEEDGWIANIDPSTDERVAPDLKTGGHPESFQVDGDRVYVNVPDAGNVVECINRKTGAVARWPLRGARQNYAMALDAADHRLFVIARKHPLLVVLDTLTGKEVTRLPAAGESDDVFFDPGRKRVYVIGGEGYISVFQQLDPAHYQLVANVPSTISAKTGYFFVTRDRLYVGVPAKGNQPAQVWTYEAQD